MMKCLLGEMYHILFFFNLYVLVLVLFLFYIYIYKLGFVGMKLCFSGRSR